MKEELKELLDTVEELENSGIVPKDGSEYIYQLIIERGRARARASRSKTKNNNKESNK